MEPDSQSPEPERAAALPRATPTPPTNPVAPPAAEVRFALGQCSLGALLVAATERGVRAVALGDDPATLEGELRARFPRARLAQDEAGCARLLIRVAGLVDHPRQSPDLPLDLHGTPFQRSVWRALREIPPGETATYAELATRIGAPRAVRAVAQACGANPVAVVVPCHRVVRKGGGLAGYRWGVWRKRALLERERSAEPEGDAHG